MDVSSQEGEIPHPISSTYGGGGGHVHMIHRDPPLPPQNHIIPSSALQLPSNGPILHAALQEEDHMPYNKKVVRYRECLKNHAAAMGGNATDGCGEFMPCGEEGTIEALKCSACNCHRNFHRKEMEGECESPYHHHINDFYHNNNNMGMGRKMIVGHHHHHHKVPLLGSEALGYPTTGTLLSSRAPPPPTHHQMIMSFNNLGGSGSLPSESDEQEGVMPRTTQLVKKRFRTKFTQEQKEKMLGFAEKVGWKMQKQEEAVVQQLCQEIGIKRRVLKVWMHNNKHNLAKKNSTSSIT